MKAAEVKGQLETGDSVEDTIKSRTQDQNPASTCCTSTSGPMEAVEPIVVETCIRIAATGKPMKKKEAMEFARSIISGTEIEREYIEWLKKNIQAMIQIKFFWQTIISKAFGDGTRRI